MSDVAQPPSLWSRRGFLRSLAGTALVLAPRAEATEDPDQFRGIFPIMQTPYLESGEVDMETLALETRWLDRAGAHGIVWPQLASEYAQLTFDERIEGMSTIVNSGRGLRPKIVLGVQAEDAATAVRYAKHAAKVGPDAIIALPPRRPDQTQFDDLDKVADYYLAISRACDLPLFIQAIGNMSVEFILDLMKKIPTLHFVKDEAGHTLSRISEFAAAKSDRRPLIFTGGHGRTLIDEMARGSAGNMPAASWVDLYVTAWDLWHDGLEAEAIDSFSRAMLFVTQVQAYGLAALSYVLHLRGVFRNWIVRSPNQRPLDELSQQALRRTFEFVKPYLRT